MCEFFTFVRRNVRAAASCQTHAQSKRNASSCHVLILSAYRAYAALTLEEDRTRLTILELARLQLEQARDHLEVVLHAMVNLLKERSFLSQ